MISHDDDTILMSENLAPSADSFENHRQPGTMKNKSATSRRGFASMSKDRVREIAREGGRAAHRKGTAHEWTPAEAAAAGRKGGSR